MYKVKCLSVPRSCSEVPRPLQGTKLNHMIYPTRGGDGLQVSVVLFCEPLITITKSC